MITRFLIAVPPEAGLEPSAESEKPELILSVDGLIVQEDKLFDEFKVRFKLDPPDEAVSIALALERALRPEHDFIVHLRVTDEVSGAESYLHRSFTVPSEPQVIEEPPVPEGTIIYRYAVPTKVN